MVVFHHCRGFPWFTRWKPGRVLSKHLRTAASAEASSVAASELWVARSHRMSGKNRAGLVYQSTIKHLPVVKWGKPSNPSIFVNQWWDSKPGIFLGSHHRWQVFFARNGHQEMGNGKTRTIFCPWPQVVNFWARRWICLSFRFSRWGGSGNLRWHRAIEAMENLLNMALMSLSRHDLKLQYAINCDMLTQRESSIFLIFFLLGNLHCCLKHQPVYSESFSIHRSNSKKIMFLSVSSNEKSWFLHFLHENLEVILYTLSGYLLHSELEHGPYKPPFISLIFQFAMLHNQMVYTYI